MNEPMTAIEIRYTNTDLGSTGWILISPPGRPNSRRWVGAGVSMFLNGEQWKNCVIDRILVVTRERNSGPLTTVRTVKMKPERELA